MQGIFLQNVCVSISRIFSVSPAIIFKGGGGGGALPNDTPALLKVKSIVFSL